MNKQLFFSGKLIFCLLIAFSLSACSKEPIKQPPTFSSTEQTKSDLMMLAEKGDMKSQYRLGRSFSTDALADENGYKNPVEAEKWLLKSAEQGFIPAQYELYAFYDDTKQNEKSLYWLTKAAENGHAEAQHDLAVGYEEKAPAKAFEWYKKSADQGYSDSECWLGSKLQQKGQMKEAFYYYKRSVEHGGLDCYDRLALFYEQGFGTKKDISEAIKNYEIAAGYGYAGAMYRLGHLYLDGLKVQKDKNKAVNWIEKSAYFGEARAQKEISAYEFAVNSNVARMYAWAKISLEGNKDTEILVDNKGDTVDKNLFNEIKLKMTTEQIRDGEQEYEKIKSKIVQNLSEAEDKRLTDNPPSLRLQNYEKEKYFN